MCIRDREQGDGLAEPFRTWSRKDPCLQKLHDDLWPRLNACASAEKEAFLRGIQGQRIAAGPSGAPSRGRPDVLPTGRNFYSVDLRGLPTEAAWDLGRRSAEQLLDLHLLEQGNRCAIWRYRSGEQQRCAMAEKTLLSCWP